MGLETGTYITDLVDTNPTNTDNLSQADDHMRLIKSTIQATFNGFTGTTTNITESQLKNLATLTNTEIGRLDPQYHSGYKATATVASATFATPATWTTDVTNGPTWSNATGLCTIGADGDYRVRLACRVDLNFTDTFSFGLSIDGADPTGRWLQADAIAGSDVRTLAMEGVVALTAAQTLEWQSKVATQTATVTHIEILAERIG